MPERRPRAGASLTRRASAQWPLLTVVFAALVVCSTLVGMGSLLLTVGQHRALAAAVAAADGAEGSGSADLVTASIELARPPEGEPEDTRALLSAAAATMEDAARPYSSTTSTWVATPMLYLPGEDPRLGYLLDADSASKHARLAVGRWPEAVAEGSPIEVAVPTAAAAALDLAVGDGLRLTASPVHPDAQAPDAQAAALDAPAPDAPAPDAPAPEGQDVVVVGLVVPDGSSSWARDVLGGLGVNSQWGRVPAYGPFLAVPGALIDADAPAGHVSLVLDPDLSGDPDALPGVARAIGGLDAALGGALGSRAESVLVRSDLPGVVSADRAEQSLTAAIVLVVVLLVLALAVATLGLVGRLIVQRRAAENALLVERGASRTQLVGRAAAESLILAALATAIGAPLALLGYRAMASAPPLKSAWVAASAVGAPALTLPVVIAVALGALAPAAVLVAVAMRDHPARARRLAGASVARSGADLLLVGIAVFAFLQLRAHNVGTGSMDPVLVAAPVLCVVAGAALALRVIPLVARLAELRARRGTGLVLPLAGWQVARGRATSGAFLMVLATVSATFGVVFLGTWSASQQDQADASVGADLVAGEVGPPGTGAGLAAATGGTVVPVTARHVTLGSRPGGSEVVALDTRVAGDIMRGRLPDGESWASLTAGLAPADPVAALTVSSAGETTVRLVMTGTLTDQTGLAPLSPPSHMSVTPTVVLQDACGARVALEGDAILADGLPHDVDFPAKGQDRLPQGEWSVVALDLRLGLIVEGGLPADPATLGAVSISVDVPGAAAAVGTWTARPVGQQPPLEPLSTELEGTTVTTIIGIWVVGLVWADTHVVLLGWTPAEELPVVVSDELARELGLSPDDQVSITMGMATIPARLVRSVPYVPGSPRGAVVLADSDALSRAVLAAGELGSLTDAWWVTSPGPDAAAAADAAGLGPVQTREGTTERLRDGPLRVALRAAIGLLVVAAVALAIAGTAAHAAAAALSRGTEFARLRGLGIGRRALLATGMVEHVAVTGATVLVGGLLGGMLAWLIAPLLVVGEGGVRAVPGALVSWQWAPLATLWLALFAGGVAVGVPAVRSLVGRASALGLRMGDSL